MCCVAAWLVVPQLRPAGLGGLSRRLKGVVLLGAWLPGWPCCVCGLLRKVGWPTRIVSSANALVWCVCPQCVRRPPPLPRHLCVCCALYFLAAQTTRILVTHQLQHLPSADHVVVLRDGRLAEQGTYEELVSCWAW